MRVLSLALAGLALAGAFFCCVCLVRHRLCAGPTLSHTHSHSSPLSLRPPNPPGFASAQDATTTSSSTRPSGRPVPRGPAAGPNYIPTPEEVAEMNEAERIRCGACQFWSPTAEACVAVPLKYDCQGTVAGPALMGCGVECAYYEEDNEHGE
jgi:hypothetical protein